MTVNRRDLFALTGFATLWWLLSGGVSGSWVIGVPAVLAATWSVRQPGKARYPVISASGAARFLPLFLRESLRGGIDVARRTLSPRLRIQPSFTTYQSSLQYPQARVFFANCVCLLPGTLAADIRGNLVVIHILDTGADIQAELLRLERAVAGIYRDGPILDRSGAK